MTSTIDAPQLGRWLDRQGAPAQGELPVIETISGWSQNTLLRVTRGDNRMVLRMPGARADQKRLDELLREIRLAARQRAQPLHTGHHARRLSLRERHVRPRGARQAGRTGGLGDDHYRRPAARPGLGYDGDEPRADFYLDVAGMPKRRELLAHYETISGLSTENIDYYLVLANFKIGIVLEKTYAAAVRSGKADPRVVAAFGPMVLQSISTAADMARSLATTVR